jgi:hypothetical protein
MVKSENQEHGNLTSVTGLSVIQRTTNLSMTQTSNVFAGLEQYFKKPKVTSKKVVKTQSAAATLPQVLKGFKEDKPTWIGGVKKSQIGGFFDSGACQRFGIGQELAKAERVAYVESKQKRTGKLIQTLLEEFDSHASINNPRHCRTFLPSIGKGGSHVSFLTESKENLMRVRNGPGHFRVDASDFEERLIRLRGPRLHTNVDLLS